LIGTSSSALEALVCADAISRTQLRRLFVRRNLKVETVSRCTAKKLRESINSKAPVLVFVDQDHCAVVYGYDSGNFFVADPALNRAVLTAHSAARFKQR
jgi:ABC-type bacteriocin/lantibiotic exporter with double-glycine peptidase domain